MTDIRRDLLLQQPGLVLALLISHLGLFLLAWVCLGRIPALRRAGSILLALTLSASATPAFGIAVLQPFLGHASEGTVGLIALAINLVTPLAITRGKDRSRTSLPSDSSIRIAGGETAEASLQIEAFTRCSAKANEISPVEKRLSAQSAILSGFERCP
jgi:hypothetical protein